MRRVLVADDDLTFLRPISVFLRGWGYEVLEANDGSEALSILEGEEPPAIALLDWIMPGIDGIDIVRLLREGMREDYTYIILITQKSEGKDLTQAFNFGVDDFVKKPFDADELRCRVKAGERILDYESRLRGQSEKILEYANEMEQMARSKAAQLIHSDRLATLGRTYAAIAHEIRNPNTYITGNALFLKEVCTASSPKVIDPELDEDFSKAVDAIVEGSKRIEGIVKSMKRFSARGSEMQELFDVNVSIDNAINMAKILFRKSVRIEKDFDTLPRIMGNPSQFEQVVLNLLTNAEQAVTNRGLDIFIESQMCKDEILVTVADNGPGITEKLSDKIWQPFFSTKNRDEGTGLGLAISRDIIKSHGGRIELDTQWNSGAKFDIYLPLYRNTKSMGEEDENTDS